MTLRRLLFIAVVVALVVKRRQVIAALIRLTGTNVVTERARQRST
jgi:hypothetical protein